MTRTTIRQPDLFNPQPDLFASVPQPRSALPPAEVVRPKLLAMLETARNADRMPWDPQQARINEILFPQMSNWLPEAERDDLRARFAAELARLRAAG